MIAILAKEDDNEQFAMIKLILKIKNNRTLSQNLLILNKISPANNALVFFRLLIEYFKFP